MKIDGGELVARMLDRESVDNIFGLHGGHIDPIFQACYDHNIRIIDTRHEQAAGHMADGWARCTGRPGVAVVTAGPGVTDIVTAVANAYMDSVPMVVIGGRYSVGEEEMMPLQELHGVPILESITKWSRTVYDTTRIPEYVAAAFRNATAGRPGPVFLEIPANVLAARVEEEGVRIPEVHLAESLPAPSAETVDRILSMLSEADRPAIFAGRGVWFSGATAELREFAKVTGIPVCANGMTRGAVPEDGPLGIGGFMGAGRAMSMAAPPDAVLLMGARLGMFTGGDSIIPADAKVIQVDIEPEEIGRVRDIDLGVVGDCRETLRALTEAARERSLPEQADWAATVSGLQGKVQGAFADALDPDREAIHPYRLAHDVAGLAADGTFLVADGGETYVWAELALTAQQPGRYLGHGYLGCLGIGLPFGLAAQLAHPNARIIVLTGDGSVGLNFTEFDTAVRHNLPIVVVISNDQAWGMCKHEQVVRYGEERVIGTQLLPTQYEKAAEAFGVHGEAVDRADDIIPAIERAFASGKPACVNVMTDPNVNSPMTAAGQRTARPWAESLKRREAAAVS